jgi:predicted small secreted protein
MCAASPDGTPSKENLMKRLLGLAAAAVLLLLAGCNTIEGMGKDISKAGDKIEEAAKKK